MKTYGSFVILFLTYLQIRLVTSNQEMSDDEWDYLLFVQHWPITVCSQWEERSPNNTCTFPTDDNLWTIHGIWPTKIGTKGPNFCNSSWHFNETQLEPILPELEQYWTNIEANTKLSSFWKHEWQKHGTCVAAGNILSSEIEFFRLALSWIKSYNIGRILSQSNIVPGETGYTIDDIYNSIKKVLNKDPVIQCVVDRDTKNCMISEIRLCFNKTLSLIDCDVGKTRMFWDYYHTYYEDSDILTNCNANKPIMYLRHLPVKTNTFEERDVESQSAYIEKLMNLYNILQFLIWLAL